MQTASWPQAYRPQWARGLVPRSASVRPYSVLQYAVSMLVKLVDSVLLGGKRMDVLGLPTVTPFQHIVCLRFCISSQIEDKGNVTLQKRTYQL